MDACPKDRKMQFGDSLIVGLKAAVGGAEVQWLRVISNVRFCVLPAMWGGPLRATVLFISSATGNDSCGVEADTKYNDTDQCWGPLRRVDAYRIYLVSGPGPQGL